MAFIHKVTVKGHEYCQLLERYKDEDGKGRRRLIKHLGRIPLEEAKLIAKAITEYPDLRQLFEKKNGLEQIQLEYTKRTVNIRMVKRSLPEGCCTILHGALAEVYETLEPHSIDVIITDPPYGKEYLNCYDELAKTSFHLLKPNASLLVMVGQSYLPEILNKLSAKLTYHWIVSYLTPGGQSAQLWERKVNTFWKPVLWFVNGVYEREWIGDVSKSAVNDNDKRFHEWGQSESGMADLVKRFSRPNDLILDPFMGGGTTGKVALELGRRFIGIDKDVDMVTIARRRLGFLK